MPGESARLRHERRVARCKHTQLRALSDMALDLEMVQSNPYEQLDHQSPSRANLNAHTLPTYSKSRGVAVYVLSCLFLWMFVAPLIAPTDVPPDSAPPVPMYLVAIQLIVGYGIPCLVVYLDYRHRRRHNESK